MGCSFSYNRIEEVSVSASHVVGHAFYSCPRRITVSMLATNAIELLAVNLAVQPLFKSSMWTCTIKAS